MPRILLLLVGVGFLALPAAAAARAERHPAPRHGFLVVRNASTDGGVAGDPVVTVVVRGFVIGRVAQEGAAELYYYPSGTGSITPQATGVNVSRHTVYYNGVQGTRFTGSGFRFRAVGGVWRVVVYGSGISLYAGGEGPGSSPTAGITLHGSTTYPSDDGEYSLNGAPFLSLPAGVVTTKFEAK
jgi:hypothetical protein